MRLFGLIGHPLSHSFSKDFFEKKFEKQHIYDCSYQLLDLNTIKEVVSLKSKTDLNGFNVTIPFKRSIIPFLDEISEEASAIGAVNTVKITDGKWIGFNTDVVGFEKSLRPLLSPLIKKALVLGSGGAFLAVKYVLDKLGIACSQVSRHSVSALYQYADITKSVLNEHPLIINTTPVGMFPDINQMPEIPFHLLNPYHVVYDLIYNPSETLFLKNAAFIGCRVKNGLEMLYIQAEESWKIWNSD